MTNALTWRPTLHLPDASIQIADVTEPLSTHGSWRATLEGHLYLLIGTGKEARNRERTTGYAGITEAATSGRPWVSLTHWVRTAAALEIDTLALVTLRSKPDPDALRVIECAVIRNLNRTIYMLNTVTAAPTPSRALGGAASTYAAFGELLAAVLRHHVLQGRSNPLLTPASTLRETAIRVVLASSSALDTRQVIERMRALGGPLNSGESIGSTIRRDLTQREAGNHAGQPRVISTHLNGKCLYYPAHLPQHIAVTRYLQHSAKHPA